MREAVFIKQNQAKWRSLESNIDQGYDVSPDDLCEAYMEITSDLAFAQTHYPTAKVTEYLNTMAVNLHNRIYGVRRERWSRLKSFWLREFPLVIWQERRCFLLALAIFIFSAAIGALSTMGDAGFARQFLGDSYVDMTIDNIKSGNPMAVYGNDEQLTSFLSIAFNNVNVAFRCFALGIFTSLGPIYILLVNGIMFGCFEGFQFQFGVMGESLPTVMLHGTLELTMIVVSGGAGIVMGNGWLFPGTYSRTASFLRSARRGVKIIAGATPILVIAAFIEGFFSRYTAWPLAAKLAIILASAALLFTVLVYLPFKVRKFDTDVDNAEHVDNKSKIEYKVIDASAGQI